MANWNWLIRTKDERYETFCAEDINDLIMEVARYFGNERPVLRLGLLGCDKVEDKVEMYNTFATSSDYEISEIYKIGEQVYG